MVVVLGRQLTTACQPGRQNAAVCGAGAGDGCAPVVGFGVTRGGVTLCVFQTFSASWQHFFSLRQGMRWQGPSD